MKKLLALLLVVALCVVPLVGCGGSDGNTAAGNTGGTGNAGSSGPAQAVTLTVWAPQNQIQNNVLQGWLDEFASQNADKWTITWQVAAVEEDVAKDTILKDVAASGDVFHFANDQLADLQGAGAISQLGGTYASDVTSNNSQVVIDTVTYNDGIYAFPYTHNTFFQFYDKTLLDAEDVKTMEGIMAKQLPAGAYNYAFNTAGGWMLGAWYYGAGNTIFGPKGDDPSAGVDWNNATGLAVTNYLIDLVNKPNVYFVPATGSIVNQLVGEHKLGAWWDGSWNYDAYSTAVGADNLGLSILPTFDLNGTAAQLKSFYGSKAIGVNAKSAHPAAAVALANFLASEAIQIDRFNKTGVVPCNSTAEQDSAVQADPVAQVIIEQVNQASVMQPVSAHFSNFWTNITGFNAGLEDKSMTSANAQSKLDAFVHAMETSVQ